MLVGTMKTEKINSLIARTVTNYCSEVKGREGGKNETLWEKLM